MYNSTNLIVYCDKEFKHKSDINALLIEDEISFKVVNGLKLVFSALKNPQNYVVLAINDGSALQDIQNVASKCYDYQNRVFIIYGSLELVNNFFKNYCLPYQLEMLKIFINFNIKQNHLTQASQPSTLLNKLITLELKNLGISTKYVGFKYLVGAVVTALGKNFYTDNHIDLFTNIAHSHFETVDTVERDVRHLLRTTWKNSEKLRNAFKSIFVPSKIPNARSLLQAIIEHLKQVI